MSVQSPEQNNPQFEQPQDDTVLGIAAVANMFGGPTRLVNADAEVTKVRDVIETIFEEWKRQPGFGDYRITPVSTQQTGNFAALVLTKFIADPLGSVAHVFTLIVEKSRANTLERITKNLGGNQTVELFVGVADAYTPNYFEQVKLATRRLFNDNNLNVVDAGRSVIYDITPVTVDCFKNLLQEAINAITHSVDILSENPEKFRLSRIVKNPAVRITNRVTLDANVQEATGLPVRSDITSELVMTQFQNSNSPINDNQELSLAKASGYVDLIFTPQTATMNQFQPQQPQWLQPSYIPRIMITKLGVSMPRSALEFMLLSLVSLTSLARNRAYGVVWRGQYGEHANPLRNLGAVGLQVPGLTPDGQPAILDVSGSFQELRMLMDTVLTPEPVFSMEIGQSGSGDWAVDLFASIAEGNQGATAAIVDAANNLTDGHFSRIWNERTRGSVVPLVTSRGEIGYIGYYNRDGEYRDLRELDLLALLNKIGTKDPQTLEDYLLALYGSDHPMVRLDKLYRILNRVAKDVHIKAYSRKYDFTGTFIAVLAEAVAAAGLTIGNSNLMDGPNQNVYTQTVQNWQQAMFNPNAANAVFQQNVPQQNFNFGNISGNYRGGWGFR